MNCKHENAEFVGQFSIVGVYKCPNCNKEIDPVEFHKIKGWMHVNLVEYYTKHPERLQPMWRDHPLVKHLYTNNEI